MRNIFSNPMVGIFFAVHGIFIFQKRSFFGSERMDYEADIDTSGDSHRIDLS